MRWSSDGAGDPVSYRAAFFVAAGFALLASLLALRVPDAEAAETMVRRRSRRASDEPPLAEPG